MAYTKNNWNKWRGRKDTVRKLDRLETAVASIASGGGGGGPLISEDAGNLAVEGSDGGVFVPTPAPLISADVGNIAVPGSDEGVYVPEPEPPAISGDADNALSTGSDGGLFVPTSQPPGNYIEDTELATVLKYAAPVWVLESDETEADLPGDFPTAPFFTGGPPPVVLRKLPEE